MNYEHLGLKQIKGPFIVVEGMEKAAFEEIVEVYVDGKKKLGQVIAIEGDKATIQVFEGTDNISLTNTTVKKKGKLMEVSVSDEIFGRVFNGIGIPIDGLGKIYEEKRLDINGKPLNPVSRIYPRNYIKTGISAIDGLTTLIRGQKLPIFSGNGLPHDQLAAQIVNQASISDDEDSFAIVFAAIGIKRDVAEFFSKSFAESGVLEKVVMFVNLASDPVTERVITPKIALTVAEYFAFEKNMNILVILTDMTAYAEGLREIASLKGEIPSRKGYPGYLYSELASIYERAGIIKNSKGSITQIPILTMPNDDITHPVPDLTGYITEGQIVLDRNIFQKSIYPPINILPSLSRLMKDGIGDGFTRKDHPDLASQIYASYSKVQEVRNLASVIGEDELNEIDKKYIEFGILFENTFLNQTKYDDRSMQHTIELCWNILKKLPKSELNRISTQILEEFY